MRSQDDDARLTLTTSVAGSTASDCHGRDRHAGDIRPLSCRDDADATSKMPHGAAKALSRNRRVDVHLLNIPNHRIHHSLTLRALRPGKFTGFFQQFAKDVSFQGGKFRGAALARARQIYIYIVCHPAIFNDQHPVRECHGFRDVMGHQNGGEALIAPHPLQKPLHRDAREGIERAKRLIECQHPRMADQRTGQRDALLLPAGKHRRPLAALVVEANFLQRFIRADLASADFLSRPSPTSTFDSTRAHGNSRGS